MKVLVDADALVALAKEDDTNHSKAVKIAQRLQKTSLYITPLTIPEAATVLSYRVSQKAAQEFLKEARKRKLIEIPLTVSLSCLADEIFLKQSKKGTSWVDCLNVATLQSNQLDSIFSFDKFYQKFKINTKKILSR